MKRAISLAVIFAAACLAGDKEAPPAGSAPKPFKLAATEDFTLLNGMHVTIVPFGVIPRVSVRVFIGAGRLEEPAGQTWISHLTAQMLKEGSTKRSADQVAQDVADMGGQLEVDTDGDFTNVGGTVLSDHAQQFVALLGELLQHPALPASELSRIKADLARQLAVDRSRPESLARERFLQTLFPNHPYSRIYPTEAELAKLSLANVQEFHSRNFTAARSRLYIAGKLDGEMRKAVEEAFGGWQRGEPVKPADVKAVKERTLQLIDRPGAEQSSVYLGLPVPLAKGPDYIPLNVMDTMLGGAFASRITSNIREQKGYTYSPFSTIGRTQNTAFWVEIADVTTSVTGPSLKEIFYEVDRIRKEPPPPEELKAIQNYMAGLFVIRNTGSADALINQLHFVDAQGLGRGALSEYVQKVNAVTPQDIQRVAESYLVPSKMTVVVVGDKAKITDQLKPFEP